ncbi:MAG: insulinase family protein [Planctomycetes bacterium]|nr:insulinase family protein [Planctomycetota bacterium]
MKLDRRTAPPRSGPLEARLPRIVRRTLDNGLALATCRASATPETLIEISVGGGRSRERLDELGLASLVAKLLQEGTRKHTTVELVDALDYLGASLHAAVDEDSLTLSLRALDRHLGPSLELLIDTLLEPRFDALDFERVRTLRLAALRSRGEEAARVADRAWDRLLEGPLTSLGHSALGTQATIAAASVARARAFHERSLDPRGARVALVGNWSADEAAHWLDPLVRRWPSALAAPSGFEALPASAAAAGLYCVDRPLAAQTELRIGHRAVAASHPDWLLLAAMNYPLGGQFSSRLNLNLREQRGFTYGVHSGFEARRGGGSFTVGLAVQSRHTAESIREVRRELAEYLAGPTDAELAFTREALEQGLARQFETASARLSFVHTVEHFGWPDDYPLERLRRLAALAPADLAELARAHLHPSDLRVLAVGPRAELESLAQAVRELDLDGAPLADASACGARASVGPPA